MALGITLIGVAFVLLGAALVAYLHGQMGHGAWILFVAVWLAIMGGAIIDERNALECVQEVEVIEGTSSFHSFSNRMPEATRAIQDYQMTRQ